MIDRHLPARWLKKFLETGSLHDACAAAGRSIDFGEDMKDMITDIDLERTKKQKFCSAPFIRNIMKQLKLERVP